MEQFLEHLRIRDYQKRKVGIIENGSWAPSAGRGMKKVLEEMKDLNIVEPIITIKSRMKKENIEQLEKLADEMLKD